MAALKSQGTHLYYIDTSGSDPEIVRITCPTGISGLGGASAQINVTCLTDLVDEQFIRGLGTPGAVSVPFILDPTDASHQQLFALKDAGTTVHWLIGLSESGTAPTLDSDDTFGIPADRTSIEFDGYVSDLNLDFAGNTVVSGTLSIQRSGGVVPHWFTPS